MIKQPIVEKCKECKNVSSGFDEFDVCRIFLIPSSKWRIGNCPMATHVEKEKLESKFVDPLKASKQKMKKKA